MSGNCSTTTMPESSDPLEVCEDADFLDAGETEDLGSTPELEPRCL